MNDTLETTKPDITDDHQAPLQTISDTLAIAIANQLFPYLDNELRAGRHITSDDVELFEFLLEYQYELEGFYQRYNVELVKAPENFYYLRPKSTSIIGRSVLSELEMLVGKVLCYLYLSPERLAQQGIFTTQDVYDELLSLADNDKLLRLVNNRSSGSDLDRQKLAEKVRSSLNRLKRIGIVKPIGEFHSQKFMITEAAFHFGADVRSGEDALTAQRRLIQIGEATNQRELNQQNIANNEPPQVEE